MLNCTPVLLRVNPSKPELLGLLAFTPWAPWRKKQVSQVYGG